MNKAATSLALADMVQLSYPVYPVMTQAELKALTEKALQQAYSAQVMALYRVLSAKLLTARGWESIEAAIQFEKELKAAKDTFNTATAVAKNL